MEIERKWMVSSLPEDAGIRLPVLFQQFMRQGYVCVHPTVRIREERMIGGGTDYVLCFKSEGGLARKEIELSIPHSKFLELEDLISLPLIPKLRVTYQLPDGLRMEVNHVDEGQPTEFWYAEVEYESEAQARSWDPASVGLGSYLNNDVTGKPGQSMGAYWLQTRLRQTVPADMY